MDRLLLMPPDGGAPRPRRGAVDAMRGIAQLGCEVAVWTALGAAAAAAAAEALDCGDETTVVHDHPAWFHERLLNARLVYTRPSLLLHQQAARSDSLEHVLIFDARMDAVRGYRQNCIVIDARRSRVEWVAQCVAAVVHRLVRLHLAVPEFLASRHAAELLTIERRPPLTGGARPADSSPPPPVPVPVLRPTAALAALGTGIGAVAAAAAPRHDAAAGRKSGVAAAAARPVAAAGEQLLAIGLRPDAADGLLLGDPLPLPELAWPRR